MRANVQRPFPHQAGKISTPAHFRGNFAARQDIPPVSSTSPHPRRAAPGKTSRPGRLPLYQPPLLHPRRAISGEISQACQTARPSVQPNLTRTGVFREKLHKPKNHSAADGPKATPHQTAQRSPTRPNILVKLRGPLDGATIIHPPVRPGQTSYARKRPPDARPSK